MISAEELKGRLPSCDAVARDLYGIEFRRNAARCPFPENHNNGDHNPSLRYDPKKDRIFCASQQCFGDKGVDGFGLVKRMEPCEFPTAASILQGQYGPFNGVGTGKSRRPTKKPPRQTSAQTVREPLKREGFQVVEEFHYSGELRKVRFEHRTETQPGKGRPKKNFRWEYFADGQWWSGDGGKEKPPYLNQIFRESDQLGAVLGAEGEAKADLAGELGLPAFSFREDISPQQAANLVDCDVILWPDNDKPGRILALARAEVLAQHSLARSISIIEPPGELPESGDIVDAVRSLGWEHQRIENLLQGAQPYFFGNSGFVVGERGFGPATALDTVDAPILKPSAFGRGWDLGACVNGGVEGRAGDAPLPPKWLITMGLRQKNRFNECKACGCEPASNHMSGFGFSATDSDSGRRAHGSHERARSARKGRKKHVSVLPRPNRSPWIVVEQNHNGIGKLMVPAFQIYANMNVINDL